MPSTKGLSYNVKTLQICQRNDLGQGMVCLLYYRPAMSRKVVGSSLQSRRPGEGLMTGRECRRGAVMGRGGHDVLPLRHGVWGMGHRVRADGTWRAGTWHAWNMESDIRYMILHPHFVESLNLLTC